MHVKDMPRITDFANSTSGDNDIESPVIRALSRYFEDLKSRQEFIETLRQSEIPVQEG